MECDWARLSATGRPVPFRIENLGSWASLDDGDVSANARHATLSGPIFQRKRQSRVDSTDENLESRNRITHVVMERSSLQHRPIFCSQIDGGGVPPELPPVLRTREIWDAVVWLTRPGRVILAERLVPPEDRPVEPPALPAIPEKPKRRPGEVGAGAEAADVAAQDDEEPL